MRSTAFLAFLLLLTAAEPSPAAEITGAATPLDPAFCASTGHGALRCPGPSGVDAYLRESGPERLAVSLGAPEGPYFDAGEGARAGSTMEWRAIDGRPFAGILRYRLALAGETAEILAILKVAGEGGPGCLVAVVDAGVDPKGARAFAQRIAEERAPSFRCGVDGPRIAGFSRPEVSLAVERLLR